MGRRKIEIKAIKDDRNRSVTFLKRKGGLFKKAHELSVLCSVDVAVFIFGSNKKLYEYSSGDMRELITRYTYHGGPNEHKGPGDFNGGDDEEEEEGDGTPPHGTHEGSVEPQMIPAHFQGQPQPPFPPHLRGVTPSASPPINGVAFQRGHTPQPQMGSRPSSRNDYRRQGSLPHQHGPPPPPQQPLGNTYAFMPHPAIYNPQTQPNMPPQPMPHGVPHQPQPGQYPYPPPQQQQQQPPPPQHYMEEPRRTTIPPPAYSQAPAPTQQRPLASPPQHQQPLPAQPQGQTKMSPPQPPHQQPLAAPPLPPPQIHEPPAQQAPPAPMELKGESSSERRSSGPLLDTASAIKKLPARKQHSIFTPIDENRSILSQHLASFVAEPRLIQEEALGQNRSQSVDNGAVSRVNGDASPPRPQRSNTSGQPKRTLTPPSRSNSLRLSVPRPKLTVQIPDEASEAGSATAETLNSVTSPQNNGDGTSQQTQRRAGSDSQPAGPVLPPPSPSASALLSAGATGPPNPFARPVPQSQSMNIDTPVSALPSRFLNNEFLPSPSSFYPDWNFGRGSDNNTLPSPLNFATPVVGSGPSFLRDETSNKRKSPELHTAGPPPDGPDEIKRIKVDS